MHATSGRLVGLAVFAPIAVLLAGCPQPARECAVSSDCAAIEVCTSDGRCILATNNDDAGVPLRDGGPVDLPDGGHIAVPDGGQVDGGGLPPPPDDVVLVRIDVAPETLSAPEGTAISFVAIGHADDGAMYDVTWDATWSVLDDAVLSLDEQGRAKCESEGATTVSASAFDTVGTASITVTPAVATELILAPTTVVLGVTQTVDVRAYGVFTDETVRPLSDVVTWATEDGTVATVVAGVVTGATAGETDLVALFEGLSATAPITVEAAALSSIALNVEAATVSAGLFGVFTATGTFADASTGDVTTRLVWTVSDSGLARPETGAPGVIRALAEGSVDVTATDLATNVSATASLTISPVRILSVSLRDKHTLVVKTDGSVWAWGDNRYGQLGRSTPTLCGPAGDSPQPCSPSAIVVPNLPVIRIAGAGNQQSLAVDENGRVWAWGDDSAGQLGRGGFGGAINPTPVLVTDDTTGVLGAAPGRRITQVSSGFVHNLALAADGTVYAWGSGGQGRLGLGDQNSQNRAMPVDGLPPVVFVHAGQFHSLAVDETFRVWIWGSNGEGQLGGVVGAHLLSPQLLAGIGAENAVSVAGGWGHTAVLTANRVVHTVGRGTEGQLGRSGFESDAAMGTMTLAGVDRIASGNLHMGALLVDGTVRMWGFGPYGQLGNGATGSSATPVVVVPPAGVGSLTGIQALFGGADHMMAVGDDLTLYAWGRNENGQLGIGAVGVGDTRSRPVVLPPF